MEITYDPQKNERNQRERHLGFEEALDFGFATASFSKEVREWTEEDFARAVPFSALPADLQALLSDPHRKVAPETTPSPAKRATKKRSAA